MGLIREPEGVDFIIKSKPLTKKEQEGLSKFIKEYKLKSRKRISSKKRSIKRSVSLKKNTRIS